MKIKMRKLINNKNAFLLGKQIVKIFIALFAILILIMLGVKLFGIFGNANDERKAEKVLEEIALKTEYLQSSEYTLDELDVIVNPVKGWFLKSYVFSKEAPPDGQCVGRFKSCLCMCDKVDCGGLRACKGIKDELEINEVYTQIKKGQGVGANPGLDTIINFPGILEFKESIAELVIKKETDKLVLKLK